MPISRQSRLLISKKLLSCLLLLFFCNANTLAADTWQKLQAQRFGMISQMSDAATRKWAAEFEQFIEALHQLYPQVDETQLPPLTVVFFSGEKNFAPYRNQTASGQSKNIAGFFGNLEDWSVIGMYGGGDSDQTRHVIYHEATHWFLSAKRVQLPLWFAEGIAEVFSTFKVVNGQVSWGLPLQNHIDYLASYSLQPLTEFLRVNQDEALHKVDTYYPQSWAFVHYLMFGNSGENRPKLGQFLDLLQTKTIDEAFEETFSKSYEEVDKELRLYVHSSRYAYAKAPLQAVSDELSASPASTASTEFALARLALAGSNPEIALKHANKVVELLPSRAEGYEMLALAATELKDNDVASMAINKAIEFDSHDAKVYLLKAKNLLEANYQTAANYADSALLPAMAREITDAFEQSLRLRLSNKAALRGMVIGLLNTTDVTEADAELLHSLAVVFPADGTPTFGEAILAHKQGNHVAANAMLTQADTDPLHLPADLRVTVRSLQDRWLIEWVNNQMVELTRDAKFEEAGRILEQQLADETLTKNQRRTFENFQARLAAILRFNQARLLAQDGKVAEAKTALNNLLDDPEFESSVKKMVRQFLEKL